MSSKYRNPVFLYTATSQLFVFCSGQFYDDVCIKKLECEFLVQKIYKKGMPERWYNCTIYVSSSIPKFWSLTVQRCSRNTQLKS